MSKKFDITSAICQSHFEIPRIGQCCEYYVKTLDSYGMRWHHYPECCEENCPIMHPELLEGRKLESEINMRCKAVGMIPHTERDGKKCFFCGTDQSVKYFVEIEAPKMAPVPFRVHSCNMCSLIKIR